MRTLLRMSGTMGQRARGRVARTSRPQDYYGSVAISRAIAALEQLAEIGGNASATHLWVALM